MHLSFVPLQEDGRLFAKEIIGNKKKLMKWQDAYWEHMVKRFPELERGLSASETGWDYIPPEELEAYAHDDRNERNKTKGRGADVRD